ncbi:hypothetical protein HG263_14335 [Pseudoalteromonas sp. JBTF-M23]|uniref:Uncharacterized protein n=1 Tax=Pseudoalteromonas caenipelagi TaxID=2726988 RepID=A0A849VJ08_9GAMM|nr:hypothetical protein [Pseudoalteromonas caenipelagi]NOU51711.1 hypothetical protein [Pseudoalteromonas caenipelagi]
MDITQANGYSNTGAVLKNSPRPLSVSSQFKASDTNASVSSLALKLSKAQSAIEQVDQTALSWPQSKAATHTQLSRKEVDLAKWEFEHLSKAQLETIALDPSNTFSDLEKVAAFERWHVRDQAELSVLKKESLTSGGSANNIMHSFEAALTSHIESFSALSKAMVSQEYGPQTTLQFESALKEQGLAHSATPKHATHYYAVMVDDIFGDNEPEVQSGVNGMSHSNVLKSPYEFLTREDRTLLSEMYQYAEQNNVDFKYIKRLASDLGDYRKHNDGKLLGNANEGTFDSAGHKVTFSFTDKDQATIDELLAGEGLFATKIDKGFISFITEPGQGALSHVGSYQFLQHMAEVTAGLEPSTSADEFSIFKGFASADERYVRTLSEEVYPMPEPDVVCKNGHCEVTEKGRENDVTLASESGNYVSPDLASELSEPLYQKRLNTQTQEDIWYKWLEQR